MTDANINPHTRRECVGFRLAFLLSFTMITACGDGETAQITRGGNEIGPATTEAVNERAVEIPAVRNTLATEPPPKR